MEDGSGLIIAIYLFAFVLAVLWLILPFAIFGIKGRLDQIISNQEELIKIQAHMTKKDSKS